MSDLPTPMEGDGSLPGQDAPPPLSASLSGSFSSSGFQAMDPSQLPPPIAAPCPATPSPRSLPMAAPLPIPLPPPISAAEDLEIPEEEPKKEDKEEGQGDGEDGGESQEKQRKEMVGLSLGPLFRIECKQMSKERRFGLVNHRHCVTGRDVVAWIQRKEGSFSPSDAVSVGNIWLSSGLLKPLPDSPPTFKDGPGDWFGVGSGKEKKAKKGKGGEEEEEGEEEEKGKKKESRKKLLGSATFDVKDDSQEGGEGAVMDLAAGGGGGGTAGTPAAAAGPARFHSNEWSGEGGAEKRARSRTAMRLPSSHSSAVVKDGLFGRERGGTKAPPSLKRDGEDPKGKDKSKVSKSTTNLKVKKQKVGGEGGGLEKEKDLPVTFRTIFDAFDALPPGEQEAIMLDLLSRQKKQNNTEPSFKRRGIPTSATTFSLAATAEGEDDGFGVHKSAREPRGQRLNVPRAVEKRSQSHRSRKPRAHSSLGGSVAIAAALAAKAARGPDWGSDKTSGLSTGDSDGIERRGDRGRERRRATLKGGGDRGLHTCEDVMASLSSLPCPYFELPLGAIMNREEDMHGNRRIPSIAVFLTENVFKLWGEGSVEGIFRLSVFANDLEELRKKIESVNPKYWKEKVQIKSAHHAAALFKMWLRSLESPLVPFSCYNAAVECGNEGEVYQVFKTLPRYSQSLLSYIVSFVRVLLLPKYQEITLMTSESMGVVFGPGLIRSPSSDPLEAMAKGDAERGFVENLFEKLEIEDDGGAFFFTAEKAEKLMKEGRDKESEGAGEGGEEPPLVFGENEAKDGDEDEESEKEKKKLNLSRSLSKNIRRTGTVSKTSSNVESEGAKSTRRRNAVGSSSSSKDTQRN